MIRGEIGHARMALFNADQPAVSLTTVTVTMDVVSEVAKEAMDVLMSAAYDFALKPIDRPF